MREYVPKCMMKYRLEPNHTKKVPLPLTNLANVVSCDTCQRSQE